MHRVMIAIAIIACSVPGTVRAQYVAPVATPILACSYDDCALRLEGARVLRGQVGTRVGQLRVFSATRLEPLVGSASDSARLYANEFDRNYGTGARWAAVGGLGLGVVTAFLIDRRASRGESNEWEGRHWAMAGGLVVSIAASEYGTRRLRRAHRALSRAIWWHNRELPR